MPSTPFPFITDGIHGSVPMNWYPAADSERQVLMHPSPGLTTHCTLPTCTEVRGLYSFGTVKYAVAKRGSQSPVFRISAGGTASEIGVITTSSSGPVWMFNNPTQLCIVDGVSGWVYTPSTGILEQILDEDFMGAAVGVYQDGYGLFVKPNSNEWFFSSMFDFLNYDSIDSYAKQGKPDNLVSMLSFMREIYLFGQMSTELWYNAGGDNSSSSNPTFAINTGGVIEHGCGAVASPSDMTGESPIWLTSRGQLRMASGYSTKVMSNQMFDRATTAMTSYSDAIGFSYRMNGHVFYQISFPTADQTWVFDQTTQLMHQRQSLNTAGTGQGRHRANCYTLHNEKHYVGDYANGKVYEMSASAYDDAGEEIVRTACMKEVDGGIQRLFFPPLQIICEAGVGTALLDPQIMLQFSADGGNTWSSELWRGAGLVGQYTRRAMWYRLGSGYRRMYRITCSDPVLWRILGVDNGGGQQ